MCKAADLLFSLRVEETYLLFQGADSELWYHRKQKPAAVQYLMGVSDIQEKQRKFYFVTVNSNTSSNEAESSTSCYRVTTLYIHALDTRNLCLVFVRQCPILALQSPFSDRLIAE